MRSLAEGVLTLTSPLGLTGTEAAHRLRDHGRNALPERAPDPIWRRVIRQFQSPLSYILLFALLLDVVAWGAGDAHGVPWEGIAIAGILGLNAGLGVWQEWKAAASLARLEQLAAPLVWVWRDGALRRTPSGELVPGDVVRLESGDRVPADVLARASENAMADESVLTGESLPVEKAVGDTLYAGTLLVRGTTSAVVVRTGAASALGRLAGELAAVEAERTPLERRLDRFGRQVARWVLVLAVAVALAGLWAEGIGRAAHVVLFAVALAVAAVPEGLPAILTIALTLGVERMARRRAVVRKLAAVEALGSVTVIASDKTGTLTENRIEVRSVDTPDRPRALRAMSLANSADGETAAGDPLELALLRYARSHAADGALIEAGADRVSIRSFDSAWKFMRVTVREAGGPVSYLKGAPEILLERSRLDPAARRAWVDKLHTYGAEGFRALALAWAQGEAERDLHWLGLVLLWDPPRPEVSDAIRRARGAGVRVIMITGDHPATALSLARVVGMSAESAVSGAELDRLSAAKLRRVVREANVFARVTPEHKLAIVEALQAGGEIVAVTGDGVNDGPALKRADVGIAMGQRGSDVSREVADLVLLDDNFATIVSAIEEGRGVYANIQKFVRFLFSTNLSEVLVIVAGVLASLLLGLRDAQGALLLPLTAAQLLWINLVSDGAPALALSLDRTPGLMEQRPRDPATPILDPGSLRFVVVSGAAIAAVGLALLGILPRAGESIEATRTALFVFMGGAQLLFAYPARRAEGQPLSNPTLHAAVLLSFLAQVAVAVTPGIREAFHAVPLSPLAWAAVVAGIVLAWASAEGITRLLWRRLGAAG